jgi:hypothetical protein
MRRGIYIVANDQVADQAIALLSSLRSYDNEIPIVLIPFNADFEQVFHILSHEFGVELFPDLSFVDEFTQVIADIFPKDFLKLPNKLRKLIAWFGPLDEFLYIDTDILWFEPVKQTLDCLRNADFICCDFHYKSRQLADIFSPIVLEKNIFNSADLLDVFNSGFWGSRKSAFTLESMKALLKECAAHREYFDFSSGTTDQPIMNYLVLKGITRRLNIVQVNPNEPGSWAGSPHFRQINNGLYDGECRLRYLHWAGQPLHSGGPYWDIWKYYRFRDVTIPLLNPKTQKKNGLWQRIRQQFSS